MSTRLGFGNWLVEKDNLQRATRVAFAVGRKRSNVRYFTCMCGQDLRDKVFHSMSLCQAMWSLEMARDPHLSVIKSTGRLQRDWSTKQALEQGCVWFVFKLKRNQNKSRWQSTSTFQKKSGNLYELHHQWVVPYFDTRFACGLFSLNLIWVSSLCVRLRLTAYGVRYSKRLK